MTATDIERVALELPEEARVALARKLFASLSAEQVQPLLAQEAQGWLDAWFSGPQEQVDDSFWDGVMARGATEAELDRPLGVGVPPEWTGRTLRALRASFDS